MRLLDDEQRKVSLLWLVLRSWLLFRGYCCDQWERLTWCHCCHMPWGSKSNGRRWRIESGRTILFQLCMKYKSDQEGKTLKHLLVALVRRRRTKRIALTWFTPSCNSVRVVCCLLQNLPQTHWILTDNCFGDLVTRKHYEYPLLFRVCS